MVWIGRLISIPIGVVFFTLLLVTLVLLRVTGTFLNPSYYTDELRKANIYEFALVDLLTTALDEARELEIEEELGGVDENPLVTSGLTTAEIVSAVNRAVPPEWVQGIVEQSFDQFGRYLTGERDEFAVTIRAGDQVAIVVDEVKSLLRKADAYNLLFDEVAVPAIGEVSDTKLPLGVELTSDRAVEAVRAVVDPEWVQELVEGVLDEVTPYLIGEENGFEIKVELGERVQVALEEVKALLRESDIYGQLFDEAVVPAVEGAVGLELPFGVDLDSDRLVASARLIVPPDWMRCQVEMAVDEVTPYLIGQTETFEVNVQLADRAEVALGEVKRILRDTDAYELLYAEVVEPMVAESFGGVAQLPFGVSITEEEVVSSLRRVASVEWVQEQVETIIDDAGPYLTGKVDGFATTVSLVENKREASEVIAGLVESRLQQLIDGLPECESLQDALNAFGGASGGLPSCVPPGLPLEEIVTRVGIDISDAVDRSVLGLIDDEITFTDRQLRTALAQAGAADNLEQLDKVRELLRDGWSYNETDLRQELDRRGDDLVGTLDNVREILRDGYIYTDVDLREALAGPENSNPERLETLDDVRAFLADGWTYTHSDFRDLTGAEAMANVDTGRDYLRQARTYRWVVWAPMVLLLVVIGFLGGRGWPGRVKYSASFLLASSGIIFLVFGPGYGALAKSGPLYGALAISDLSELREDALNDIAEQGGDFPNTSRLMADKMFDMAEKLADGFASGIAASSLALAMIGVAVLLAAIFWSAILGLVNRYFPNGAGLLRRSGK